ncbi:hypothetical protein psal_cds_58 [Pandoravirus salinus]|uniref:Ankyrin repeat domain containing protein n=1 Tax=Pandoravirus salinus TaxID=1349410 RepID=S4VZK4_9VIRU|nr:hypothetical protein psal_cds_58 [Pandoravirus salinus]AGO83457.1 hypothetical protein psal_cds_58 [Pandoravirus salinus]
MDDLGGNKRPRAVGDRDALVKSAPCGKKRRHNPHDGDDLFATLPDEMVARIFSHIACIDLAVRVRLVSQRCAIIAGDSAATSRSAPCFGSTPPHGRDRMVDRAAAAGHTVCLQRAIDRGEPVLARTFCAAAAGGHFEVLTHLARMPVCPPAPFAISPVAPAWDEASCSAAAAHGHLDCLVFLHSRGCPWDAWTIAAAECGGHEACAAYARTHGCPEDHPEEHTGIGCWHRDTMRCIHEHRLLGADWHGSRYDESHSPHPDGIFYAYHHGLHTDVVIVKMILLAHHLPLLAYVKACGMRLVAEMCTLAAHLGQVDSLAYLHENGCSWDATTMAAGIESGDMAVFAYLRDHGCPVSAAAVTSAARGANVDALAYLCQRGVGIIPAHLTTAAKASRRVACLRYLCEHGQRPDGQTMYTAVSRGAIDCVRYLHEIKCPWHPNALAVARARGHRQVEEYIVACGGR